MTYLEENRALLDAARGLTPHQKRILFLLTRGYQNKVIGAALGITEGAIKSHMTRILEALSCNNRTQVALVAFGLHHQIRIDDIVGRRRVLPVRCMLTDEQVDLDFLGGDLRRLETQLRHGSNAPTCCQP